MIHEFSLGEWSGAIDEDGGWVTSLTHKGNNVFIPLFTTREGKKRGGMHVCFPFFGPPPSEGPYAGMNQHGFGRNVKWKVDFPDEDGNQYVRAECIDRSYGLASLTISTTITGGLVFSLAITNSTKKPQHYKPGLHPYFQIDGNLKDAKLAVGSHDLSFETLAKDAPGDRAVIIVDSARLAELSSSMTKLDEEEGRNNNSQFLRFVAWSGGEKNESGHSYVSAEPAYNGLEPFFPERVVLLRSRESYSFDLVVRPTP